MSEEIEETEAEFTPQDEAEEIEPALEAADNQVDGADALEPVDEEDVETGEEIEGVDEVSEEQKTTDAFGFTLPNEEENEALQAKAAVAFGLARPAVTEDDLEEAEAEEEEKAEEEEELVEEYLIPDDGREWFVVHCYSGYENKVRHSIEQRIETMDMQDKIFDVVVPTEEEIEIKDGKRRTVERRVFPGYILVQMLMSEDSWYVVRNTPGVTGFVGMGNEPTPLRPDEVAKIMNRMEAEAPKVKFDFQIGEKVRIGTGPFADFIGTVAEIDADRAKVRVMVSFFGRETPVELDFLHVEKV
jgi:transcriptional antiterminator NusG